MEGTDDKQYSTMSISDCVKGGVMEKKEKLGQIKGVCSWVLWLETGEGRAETSVSSGEEPRKEILLLQVKLCDLEMTSSLMLARCRPSDDGC